MLRYLLFVGLLLMPFVSAITGNPPVNAHVIAFCLRYVPFFVLNCGLLLFLGQRYLIPGGSHRGFWWRAGLLWVAMWWEHIVAMWKGLKTRRVVDRVVAAKWKPVSDSPWRPVRPHIVLTLAAIAAFTWTCLRTDRRETIWGTLLFLGLIVLSQMIVIIKVTKKSPPGAAPAPRSAPAASALAISAAYLPKEKT